MVIKKDEMQPDTDGRNVGVGKDSLIGERDNKLLLSKEEQTYIDSRIHDIEKAATRSRWIYAFILFGSLMLFSVAYNEYFSWMRAFALALPSEMNTGHWQDRLQLLLMREWVSSLQFDLPYIGGKFGASDAGPVGGVVLFVVGIWCLYSAKRENFLVYLLAKDVHDFEFSDAAKFYLTSQIASTQLFIVPPKGSKVYRPENIEKKALKKTKNMSAKRARRYARYMSKIYVSIAKVVVFCVFMAPGLALMFVFAVDLATLNDQSPFRRHTQFEFANHTYDPPISQAKLDIMLKKGSTLYSHICESEESGLSVRGLLACKSASLQMRLSFSLFMALAVLWVMWLSWRYQSGTEAIVLHTVAWKKPLLRNRQNELTQKSDPPRTSPGDGQVAGSNLSEDRMG